MLSAANLTTLAGRREEMSRNFFLTFPTLLLACTTFFLNQENIPSCLMTYEKNPYVFTSTKRCCSFIQYALYDYQSSISNYKNRHLVYAITVLIIEHFNCIGPMSRYNAQCCRFVLLLLIYVHLHVLFSHSARKGCKSVTIKLLSLSSLSLSLL